MNLKRKPLAVGTAALTLAVVVTGCGAAAQSVNASSSPASSSPSTSPSASSSSSVAASAAASSPSSSASAVSSPATSTAPAGSASASGAPGRAPAGGGRGGAFPGEPPRPGFGPGGRGRARGGPGAAFGPGPGFGPGRGPRGQAGGTVSSISGSGLVVSQPNGQSVTYALAPQALYLIAGRSVSESAVHQGDRVQVQGVPSASGGTETVYRVNVVQAGLRGVVTSVSGNTIVLSSGQTISVTGSTSYARGGPGGASAGLSDVKPGVNVQAFGAVSNGKFTAQSVVLPYSSTAGLVTGVSGSTVTVYRGQGSQQVHLTGQTHIFVTSGGLLATGQASDIHAGSDIRATGTTNTDGSLQAISVSVS